MSVDMKIVHELPGRIRFRVDPQKVDIKSLASSILKEADVLQVTYSESTGSVLVYSLTPQGTDIWGQSARSKSLFPCRSDKMKSMEGSSDRGRKRLALPFFLLRRFLPVWVRFIMSLRRAWPYLCRGFQSLKKGRADLDLLDALAIGISLARRDFRSVMIITSLLGLGEFLEEWTRKKSMENLAMDLMYTSDKVWVKQGPNLIEKTIKDVLPGEIVVSSGGLHIPVDGLVVSGRALVNQSTMTGEPLPVTKKPGASVYAGTVVEEGEIHIKVARTGDQTRLFQLMRIIEESEKLKSSLQVKAEHMADKIVPATLFLSLFTYILTRNINRAVSVLLVDYSCAIKLSTPLTMLSAMREASTKGVAVKGGKYLEVMSKVDTYVFDKTGTLTQARPEALDVIPFNGFERREVLRMAACLEEHFPHPVASAVVALADKENIIHHERHSSVKNILAHGILSTMDGDEVMVGSRHFIEKHGQVDLAPYEERITAYLIQGFSVLYVSKGRHLAGLVLLDDPLRADAGDFIQRLRKTKPEGIYLLTGDGKQAASKVSKALRLDGFMDSLLPEQKAEFVAHLKKQGKTVAMIGDGMNDTPALSAADAGISMKHGADLTREVCDILLTDSNLDGILTARRISSGTMSRIKQNYAVIAGINSSLILLGLAGKISPVLSATLHNLTTILVSLNSLRPVDPFPQKSNSLPGGK